MFASIQRVCKRGNTNERAVCKRPYLYKNTHRSSFGRQSRELGSFYCKISNFVYHQKNGKTSPKLLIKELVLAKSNLALIASDMISQGLIEKGKDEHNKKEIFYTITEKGNEMLTEKMKSIENLEIEDVGEACILLEKLNNLLQKIH